MMVRAVHEGLRALQALGVPIAPRNLAVLFGRMPSWFAVRYWQHALRGPLGTLAIASHARAAPGEMAVLATQVLVLLQPALRSTPTLHALLAILPVSPEG
jgi:2-dehydropantoate 2-reductase